jgi:hypothetical protein
MKVVQYPLSDVMKPEFALLIIRSRALFRNEDILLYQLCNRPPYLAYILLALRGPTIVILFLFL